MDGILLLNKEKNISTRDYCFKAAKLIGEPRFGHTGTLDPLATGLVVLLLGQATKLNQYIDSDIKGYVARIRLGLETDSYDITGNIVEEKEVNFDLKELKKALVKLKRRKRQIPPIYSAVKVNGKKLYEYARNGESVKPAYRKVSIERLELVGYELIDGIYYLTIRMLVSKGFYVRSLVHDLGQILGYGATMTELHRYRAGNFKSGDAYHISDLENGFELIKIEEIFKDKPSINVDLFMANLIKNGVLLDERQAKFDSIFNVFFRGHLIAIYEPIGNNQYKVIWKDGVFLANLPSK